MRVALVVTVLAGILIGVFAPIPFLDIGTPPAEGALPSFAETRDRIEDHEPPPPPPAYGENPERRKLRKAVLKAAAQLEFNPCSKDLRRKFVAAVQPFVDSLGSKPAEYAMVDGKKTKVSARYDKPAVDVVIKALFEGYIEPADLTTNSLARGFLKAQSKKSSRRKRCEN